MANENNPNLTEMSRDILLYKLCPSDKAHGCDSDCHCKDCVQIVNGWLDEYEKQIRAKVIDDFVNACEKQFTTIYGQRYIDTRDIKEFAAQLKEQNQ